MKTLTPDGLVDLTEEEIQSIQNSRSTSQEALAAQAMRLNRNELLAASDWTQANDSPLAAEKKVEWASYRTALRNLPSSEGWPSVTFPTEPS
tara:strand:- start:226 stop:501 length:276 start_codon:yes stop_codon:yes gene_type:complete